MGKIYILRNPTNEVLIAILVRIRTWNNYLDPNKYDFLYSNLIQSILDTHLDIHSSKPDFE